MKIRILAAAAVAAALAAPASHAQDRVDQRRPASASGTVEVTVSGGAVRVVGWNRDEVRVTGRLDGSGDRVEFQESGDRLTVRVVTRRGQPSGNLEVSVPARRNVDVRTVTANAEVDRVDGAVDVRAVSGDVRVSGAPREVSATTRSGSVEVRANTARITATSVSGSVRIAGTARDAVEASTVSGTLEVSAATREVRANTVSGDLRIRGVTGRTNATTVSGDVEVDGRRVSGSFRSVSGDLRLTGDLDPAGGISFTTHSGDVELAVPRGAALEVDFATFSGALTSGFTVTMTGTDRQRRLSVGRGGPTVSIRTFSGDAKLVQR